MEKRFTEAQLKQQEQFNKSLDVQLTFLKSKIKKEEALKHINHYREGLPPHVIKSVWLDREIIDFIIRMASTHNITGLRVYHAKYKGGTPSVDTDKNLEGQQTVIVAVTSTGIAGEDQDLEEGYFNYGRPCPPTCNGDEGTK